MSIFKKVRDGHNRYFQFLGVTIFRYKSKKNYINKMQFGSVGQRVEIQHNCRIYHCENMYVGNNVRIGYGALIEGMGGLHVGNNVILGPDVTIWTANHNYENTEKLPYDEKIIFKPVHIEDNVWIGGKSIIVPGVTIHEGAIIAMGAVVTKDVPKCAVVGGNPAKVLKYRDIKKYDELKSKGAFCIFRKK